METKKASKKRKAKANPEDEDDAKPKKI